MPVPHCIESRTADPYANLALEACLMRAAAPGEPVLYLWQNERTVVIGRNQCASAECDVARLEADGGHLARRRSGGGAVYHDLGNLNFTFVARADEYDEAAQTGVILDAVRALGIEAERTGRNDLVTRDGRKFSGHAYQHAGPVSCHHGTIMVGVDVDALGRYLTVSADKLSAKGVRSVRSRVTNLEALRPDITVGDLKAAIREAFARAAGSPLVEDGVDVIDADELEAERARFASRAWLFRGERGFAESRAARFGWGSARADFTLEDDTIADLVFFSDGLDTVSFDALPGLLQGVPARAPEIKARLLAGGIPEQMAHDIADLIAAPQAERSNHVL